MLYRFSLSQIIPGKHTDFWDFNVTKKKIIKKLKVFEYIFKVLDLFRGSL